MKFVRFDSAGRPAYGLLTSDEEVIELEGDISAEYQRTNRRHELSDIRILPPCDPSKILAIGKEFC